MPVKTAATKTHQRIERLRALAGDGNPNEHERAVATHMLAKLVARQGGRLTGGGIDWRRYGTRYDHTGKLTTTDIAALIRTEIKIARKLGQQSASAAETASLAIPDPIGDMPAQIKVSVRARQYSGGCAIDVNLTNVPLGWGFAPAAEPTEYRRFDRSAALNVLVDALDAVRESYNHDGSDVVSGYSDVRFYGGVEVAHPEDTDCAHGYRLTDSCPCCP